LHGGGRLATITHIHRGMIMRTLLALALLVLSATAQAQTEPRITVIEYGIVSATDGKKVPDPGTATGFTREVTNFKIVRQAETIVAKLGTRFGIRYRIDGVPRNQVLKVKCITRFPAGGVTNVKGQKVEADEYDCAEKSGEVTWRSYTFEEPWELIAGDWNLEFWYGGKKIGEKRFAVVAP
jgi:hypothetical protein